MKVLLSAYACEPGKGSEPGVGWRWALEIAHLGHEVWVLTRTNNQPSIDLALAYMQSVPNLHFLYYDLPAWAQRWKKLPGGIVLYYLLWQWGAYQLAETSHCRYQFDVVHHITFVSVRRPSFMGNLGIPFIFGPVAGGERAPWRLRIGYGWRGWILDCLRDLANLLVLVNPLARRTFRQAAKIYVTSEQTRDLLPDRYRGKSSVQLAIGSEVPRSSASQQSCKQSSENQSKFGILFAGRFLYWKGMHLGLAAFADAIVKLPDARLTMVGSGPDEIRWHRLANKLGISENIDWIRWVPQDELKAIYAGHDVFLFPSLHDSGGMVALEAMTHGLPVVCLDLGGPGMIVNDTCGCVISTAGRSESQISTALAEALNRCAIDPTYRRSLGAQAKQRAQEFTWNRRVRNVYCSPRKAKDCA